MFKQKLWQAARFLEEILTTTTRTRITIGKCLHTGYGQLILWLLPNQ